MEKFIVLIIERVSTMSENRYWHNRFLRSSWPHDLLLAAQFVYNIQKLVDVVSKSKTPHGVTFRNKIAQHQEIPTFQMEQNLLEFIS